MLSPTPLNRHGLSTVATSPQRHGAGCTRPSPSPWRLGMSSWLGAAAMVVRLGGLGASSWPSEVDFFWYIRYIRITVPSSLSTKLFGRDKEGLWKICNKQKHETRTTLMVVRSVSFPPHIFWIFEMSRMCFNKLRYEERCVELTVVLGFFLGAHQCLCQFFLWLSNR